MVDMKRKLIKSAIYGEEIFKRTERILMLGAVTDKQLAEILGVPYQTLTSWKKRYPEYQHLISIGRMEPDSGVAATLYQRAMGYEVEVEKPFVTRTGEVKVVKYRQHVPPDVQAIKMWLSCRQPDLWREKQAVEHTGRDGEPLLGSMSEQELVARLLAKKAEAKVEEREPETKKVH